MTTALGSPLLTVDGATAVMGHVAVEIVIPVHNEEAALEASIRRLHAYLDSRFPVPSMITVADNASVDQTWSIACRLAGQLPGVRAVHLDQKGRGRALRSVWLGTRADVVAYMDVDLSTDLDALLPLVAPLLSGHSDVAIGSRLAPGARVRRGPKREVISRGYNLILKATLRNGFTDAQCGFKAVRADIGRVLLPMVEDDGWFFDTELLVLAEHNGLRIHEVPVDWIDDPDSRVDVTSTAVDDLRGIWRMVKRFAVGDGDIPAGALPCDAVTPGLAGQLVRFAGVGVLSTVVFAALFLLLAPAIGAVLGAVGAFATASVVNIAANRRVTFARRGRAGRRRQYAAALAIASLPLTVGLVVLLLVPGVGSDLAALTVINLLATAGRFVLLRHWVFAR